MARAQRKTEEVPQSPARTLDPDQLFEPGSGDGLAKNRWRKGSFIFDQAIRDDVFSGLAEIKLLTFLMGEQEDKKNWHGVTISQPNLAAGSNIPERTIIEVMAHLTSVGVVELKKAKRGNMNCYHVNLRAMATAPRYLDWKPKLEIVPKPEPAGPATQDRRWVIPPGKVGQIRYPVPIPGTDQWTEDTMDVDNGATNPMALIATRVGKRVRLRIEDAGARDLRIEPSNPLRGSVSQVIENKQERELLSNVVGESQAYRAALKTLLENHFGEAVNAQIVKIVTAAAGSELPASEYLAYADRKLTARLKSKRETGTGFLVEIAKDCRSNWDMHASDRAEKVAKAAREKTENERMARESAFDPSGDETTWPLIRKALRAQVTDVIYQNWFARTRGEGLNTKGTLLVTAPNAQTAAFLTEEYRELVNRTAQAVDASIERVQFRAQGKTEASHG
jgi:hypothetical protein